MPGFGEELDAKGPAGVPVWAYGAILAAGFLGWNYLRNRNASPAPAPNTAGGTDPSASGAGVTYDYGAPTMLSGAEVYPYTVAPPSPATNSQWERAVTDWLISKGETPGETTDTVSDYLDGEALSAQERHMIALAEDFWGSPPQGVAALPSGPGSALPMDTDGDEDGGEDTGDGGSSGTDGNSGTPGGGPKHPRRKRPVTVPPVRHGPVERKNKPPARKTVPPARRRRRR